MGSFTKRTIGSQSFVSMHQGKLSAQPVVTCFAAGWLQCGLLVAAAVHSVSGLTGTILPLCCAEQICCRQIKSLYIGVMILGREIISCSIQHKVTPWPSHLNMPFLQNSEFI